MAQIGWVEGNVPEGMEIKQVYGIIMDNFGRVMLRVEKKTDRIKYSLAGGHPELFDNGIEGTCRRELIEEVNTEIETPIFIGYQLVDEEDGTPKYAQVRMAALIRNIGERRPDPDNGKIYNRFMVTPEKAIELLNWGDVGYYQIMAAKKAIYEKYGITTVSDKEEWV